MIKRIGLALAALVAVLGVSLYAFSQLRTTRIEVPPPKGVSVAPDVYQTPSRLTLDLQVSVASLAKALNKVVPKEHGGVAGDALGNWATEDTLTWSAKLGTITLSPAPDGLAFRVPLVEGKARVKGRVGLKKRNKGLLGWLEDAGSKEVSQSAEFSGSLDGTLRPRLMPDWTVQPNLTLSARLSKAEAGLFGDLNVPLSIRGLVEKDVRDALNKLAKDLNAKMARDGVLRARIQKAWHDLHLTQQVHPNPPVWAELRPVALGIKDPTTAEGFLRFVLEVSAHTLVRVGEPPPAPAKTALPAPRVASDKGGFVIGLPVAVSLSQFHGMTAKEIGIPQTINTSAAEIRVERLHLTSDGSHLYVGADLVADMGWLKKVEATVYVAGRPVLDEKSQRLRLENLAYEVRTRNALAGVADVLLEPVVLEHLRAMAVFDATDARRSVLERAASEVAKLTAQLPAGIKADLELRDVRIVDARVAPDWLYFVLEASGTSRVLVDGLDELLPK